MAYMTTAQALVKFLDNQYVSFDGRETKFVDGIFTIFGHGIVCGLGEALDSDRGGLTVYQGKNEQGMAHVATAFAKQNNRRKIIACSSSIGPGAANMITAAATATVNHIPLLLFPADSFASRQPDPVLQQFEQVNSLATTTNDAYKAVTRYWDRISRPEQLMSAMINAMRVLTDTAETGAVCISLPQDVEGESYDFPDEFLAKRVHKITRIVPSLDEVNDIAEILLNAEKPLVICGGGVRYSEAGEALEMFCKSFGIPFAETQSGKTACLSSDPLNLGGLGVTGNSAGNVDKELVWGIDSRKMGMPIVQTLLVFAQRNHIWVTAEGIETREQAEQLEKLGCNFLQGYLISRPLPADRCVEFVADWEKKDILAQPGQEDDDCRNHMKQLRNS